MSEVIIHPDVELWAANYLRPLLANRYPGVRVSNDYDGTVPSVWVRRDGGPMLDRFRDAATVGINVFASTEQAATDMARVVAAYMLVAADGLPVLRVDQTAGPSSIPEQKCYRRFLTFEVWTRGARLEP